MNEKENPYSPPRSAVADTVEPEELQGSAAGRFFRAAGVRFLWATGVCLALFIVLILLVGNREIWFYAALGGAMFSMLAGLIAVCIPVRSKAGFIIPAVLLSLVIAYQVGKNARESRMQAPIPVERE